MRNLSNNSNNRMSTSVIVFALLFGQMCLGAGLDRGHRVLVDKGLQIGAVANPAGNAKWSAADWADSKFTMAHSWNSYDKFNYWQYGQLWSKNLGNTYWPNLEPQEEPYLPYLVSWGCPDEGWLSQNLQSIADWIMYVRYTPRYDNIILFHDDFPSEAEDDVRYYLQYAKPDMLVTNAYPFNNSSTYGPDNLYPIAAKYRRLGLEGYENGGDGSRPIPYGMYLQTFTGDFVANYRPSESEIRFNQFALLAFGFKWLVGYMYDDQGHGPTAVPLMFDSSGNRTAEFNYIAETTRQSKNLGPALVRLLSTDIRIKKGAASGQSQTTAIPDWQVNLTDPQYCYITEIKDPARSDSLTSGDVLIGFFKPLDESFDGSAVNQKYFMIVNAQCRKSTEPNNSAAATSQTIKITFNLNGTGINGANGLQRVNRNTGAVETVALTAVGGGLYSVTITLEGGTGDLFKFNTGAPFVGTYSPKTTFVFQQGVNGYAGNGGNWDRGDAYLSSYSGYGAKNFGYLNRITLSGSFNTSYDMGYAAMSVWKDIIGSGANQILPGSTIKSAKLRLYAYQAINPYPGSDASFKIFSWNKPVYPGSCDGNEADPWNPYYKPAGTFHSTGNYRYIEGGWNSTNAWGSYQAKIGQDTTSTTEWDFEVIPAAEHNAFVPRWVEFDVTGAVQAWVNGSPNYGFALFNVGNGWNGCHFRSAEYWDVAYRPQLVVELVPADCAQAVNAGYQNQMDYNGDCKVDLKDFVSFAMQWAECVDPAIPACDKPWLP